MDLVLTNRGLLKPAVEADPPAEADPAAPKDLQVLPVPAASAACAALDLPGQRQEREEKHHKEIRRMRAQSVKQAMGTFGLRMLLDQEEARNMCISLPQAPPIFCMSEVAGVHRDELRFGKYMTAWYRCPELWSASLQEIARHLKPGVKRSKGESLEELTHGIRTSYNGMCFVVSWSFAF